jgi:hypothetical protein
MKGSKVYDKVLLSSVNYPFTKVISILSNIAAIGDTEERRLFKPI